MSAAPPRAPKRNLFERMNKTETAFAIDLEAKKRSGQIAEWWFEAFTFRLGDDLRYTPDFIVQANDGALSVCEVKGFWRDDARAKIKMFAELYPFPTKAFTRAKTHSGWDVEVFR